MVEKHHIKAVNTLPQSFAAERRTRYGKFTGWHYRYDEEQG